MSTGTIVLIVVVVVVVVAAAILVPVLRRRSTARSASASAKLPALGQLAGDPNAAPKDHHRNTPADPPAPTV